MYAEVVVNVPLRRQVPVSAREPPFPEAGYTPRRMTFHYAIPPHLSGQVAPGQLVWVPFGPHQAQGVILALSDVSPVPETRELEALVDPQPALSPAQIALAGWISDHYLAPLLDCILLMLPPGIGQRVQTILEWRPETPLPPDLTPAQRAVLNALRARKRMSLAQLGQSIRIDNWRSAVDQLVFKGVLARRTELQAPRVSPKTRRVVRLAVEDLSAARQQLGRPSQQADILAWLAASEDPLPSLAQVCRAVGCNVEPVRALARRGLVVLTERRAVLTLLVPPNEVDRLIRQELGRAKAQAAVLAHLRDHRGTAEASELSAPASAIRALESRGYVGRVVEEPAVMLNIPHDQVDEAILALRGAQTCARVLDLLAQESEPVPVDVVYAETGATSETLRILANRRFIVVEEQEIWRDPLAGREFVPATPPALTPDQARVWEEIEKGIKISGTGEGAMGGAPPAYLLHGVTGSGKTEIYLRAIGEVLAQGRQAIVLVPEIALTPQTVRRFAARFPGRITVWHSQLSLGERYDSWRRVRDGEIDIVIGSRSALFAPLPRLGLIVVDEEHEGSYKQDKTPRYHAREVALRYAALTGAVVILGSATPDVETYYRAQRGEFRLLELPKRIVAHRQRIAELRAQYLITRNQPPGFQQPASSDAVFAELPPVEIVDLRAELRAGNRSIFSRALQAAMERALAAGEQVILFLNRRGTATFVLCRDCGHVLTCPRCHVPLTYHSDREDLTCHHCNYRRKTPRVCPQCGSRRVKYFGIGTQRVEEVTRQLFPEARVIRWDRDTTGGKLAHEIILDAFIKREANVMIGTQMIAKGLDLPLVTLVGVVSADTALHLPDFRAGERTFQLLTQVAGRAGRSILGGRVIIQTYSPEHYAIQAAGRHDYAAFYSQEIAFRRQAGYPPFSRLIRMIYLHHDAARCQAEAERMARVLLDKMQRLGLSNVGLIGPAPAFLERLRGQYRWQIIVRGWEPHQLLEDLPLPLGWRVDVDPVSLL